MTTHRVNDIVRGKNSGRLALVLERLPGADANYMRVKYLEDSTAVTPPKAGEVVQRTHDQFEPVRPDAVGQHVRHRDGGAPLGPVLSIGQAQLITVEAGTFFRDGLVRVAEPEKVSAGLLYFPSQGDVDRFKRAWEQADREGKYGERVDAGLAASISFVVSELIAERDRRGQTLEEVRAECRAVQDHAAAERVTHARVVWAKNSEIARLEQQIADSAAQRSEVRDCYVVGGEGLELKETAGAHISIKGADIAPRGTIGTLKNRADQADAEIERLRGELAREIEAHELNVRQYQDQASNDRAEEAQAIREKTETIERLRGELDKANRELAALRPDPDAAARAALARFHDYNAEQAERIWRDTPEIVRVCWRRVAAS